MADEKNWSASFTAMKNFSDQVKAVETNKTAEGKSIYSVYGFKNFEDKEGKKCAEFHLGKSGAEDLRFILAASGTLRGVEYTDWTGVEKGNPPAGKEFVGKDFSKLAGIVKDPLLTGLAGKFDWSYAKDKETEAPEAEAEEIEIG